MTKTSIEWTDYSANLLKYRDTDGKIVWACAKVSDGCKNCYSESLAHRWKKGGPFTLQQVKKVTPFFDDKEAALILRSKKLSGQRVFIDDMTDLFGDWVSDEIIDKHFAVFALRPDVVFQVLTKRPERMAEYLSRKGQNDNAGWLCKEAIAETIIAWHSAQETSGYRISNSLPVHPLRVAYDVRMWETWPLPNVHLGTSCEDQKTADERIPHLLKCPADVRFISAEPLLGEIDLTRLYGGISFGDAADLCVDALSGKYGAAWGGRKSARESDLRAVGGSPLDWIIVGCESRGNNAGRFADGYEAAARSIIQQCKSAGVPVFHKQMPVGKRVSGEPSEWPEDLRSREFPARLERVK